MDCPVGLNLRCAKIVWLDSCFLVRIRLSRPLFFAAARPAPDRRPPSARGREKRFRRVSLKRRRGPQRGPRPVQAAPGEHFCPHPPFLCKERRRH